jgi:uncharacterized protein (TIGR03437 family)
MLILPHQRVVGRHGFSLRLVLLISIIAFALCLSGRSSAQGNQQLKPLVALSAASFLRDAPVAPGSIVTAFTSGVLPPGLQLIGTDANPNTPAFELPLVLGNLTVEVHGRPAGIFGMFGTPAFDQFNILIPSDLLPGKGPILIKDATGLIRAAGEIEIAAVAPSIFTANVNGQGVPAAYILRVLPSGEQRIELVAKFDTSLGMFIPQPIDLERSDELVFLVLFLTGGRGIADANETRVLVGGVEYTPDFVGPAPGFLGLEQINLRLSRGLPPGLLQVAFVHLKDGRAANACEIEIAPPAGAPPSIRGLSKAESIAGEVVEVTGTGFTPDSEVLISDATRKVYNATLMESSSTSLKVMVPYGAGSGQLIVRNGRGEASFPFRMRTSMSGIVQRVEAGLGGGEQRVGIRGVTIRIRQNNVTRTATTNDDGSFVIADVMPTSRLTFEVDGTTNGVLPLPKDVRSLAVMGGRDNQYEGYIELKAISGPSAMAGSNGHLNSTVMVAQQHRGETITQRGMVVFDPQGSIARFPDGTTIANLTVTVLDPRRFPANLPPGHFSSTIVQLTPFGATLDPGGRLTFPNSDGYAANEVVTLYRFDQQSNSNTLGEFISVGQARVTADGERIETAANAIKESTYYFVSMPRAVTTIYGTVVEEIDGGAVQPARGALVQVGGQSIFSLTDQSGTYSLRNVPIPDTATQVAGFTIEVSFLRPDGTVDRVDKEGVIPGLAGLTVVSPPIRIVAQERSRAPVISVPKSLTIEAGTQAELSFLAYARKAGQTLINVQVTGATFATVASLGNDRYLLKLAPGANAVGTYSLELKAVDNQGEMTITIVLLEVKAAQINTPIAVSQSVEMLEDNSINVTLMGKGGDRFRLVGEPRRGRLSGIPPNLVYTPEADFNGSDSFGFVVGNGTVESAPAVVTVNVRGVADAPRLTVGEQFTTNIGQSLAVVINGYDGDAEQRLTLSANGLPAGASIRQLTATSWVLEWRPTNQQIGVYRIDLTLSDDGTPAMKAAKSISITVDATWAQTAFPPGGTFRSLAVSSGTLFAGSAGAGMFRSTDNGANWTQINNGLIGPSQTPPTVLAIAVMGATIIIGTNGNGIFVTTDNGSNWTQVIRGLPSLIVESLAVSGTTIYAGLFFGGVYRSTDSGANWVQVSNGLPNERVRALAVVGTTLFAGMNRRGAYRLMNNTVNWTEVNIGLVSSFGTIPDVPSFAVIGTTIFAGTSGPGVFRSTNNGTSWINVGLSETSVEAFAVRGTALFAGTFQRGVFRSTDNGATWTEVNNGLSSVSLSALAFNETSLLAGTYGGGVCQTRDNGSNWTQINGLSSIFANALISTGTALIAGTGNGAYRTMDGGASWAQINNGLAHPIGPFVLKGGTVFAGSAGGGVYRTTDNGTNWVRVSNGLPITVGSLAVSGSTVYAGVPFAAELGGGVYLTTNDGASWTKVNNGLTFASVRTLETIGTTVFAGTDGGGVFRSTNNGANWVQVNNGLTESNISRLKALGTTLFASAGGIVFRSTDSGASWTKANNGLPVNIIGAFAVSGTTLYAGTNNIGVYRTTDNGENWTPVNNGLSTPVVRSLEAIGTTIFAGTAGGGVFVLAEANIVWAASNSGLINRNINSVVTSGAQVLVGTLEAGVYRSGDGGGYWESANTGLPPSVEVKTFARHNNELFVGLNGAGVYGSGDDGGTWTQRVNGLGNRQVNALASDGTRLLAATEGGVYRSTDNGQNWSLANTGITRQKILSLLATSASLYAGTDLGVFRSIDGGNSWVGINNGLTDLYIISLGVAPNGTTIFASTTSGVYRSTNNGASWARVTNGLPQGTTALVFTTAGTKLLAGTVSGFYSSEDNGTNWRAVNTGLLNLQVTGLAVQGNRVIAGTRSAGVFTSQLE